VPLAAGVFWKRATPQGALASVVLGIASWALMEIFGANAGVPPQLVGLLVSIAGMILGSLAPHWHGATPRQRSDVHAG